MRSFIVAGKLSHGECCRSRNVFEFEKALDWLYIDYPKVFLTKYKNNVVIIIKITTTIMV